MTWPLPAGTVTSMDEVRTDRLTPILLVLAELDVLVQADPATPERRQVLDKKLADLLGPDMRSRVRHAKQLIDVGYMDGTAVQTGGDGGMLMARGLGPRGRQELGQWPSEGQVLLSALITAIEQAEGAVPEEERGKVRRLLDAARDVGTGTTANVIAALLARVSGLG